MMRGFDSIESMNADELLVKRERGSKRCLVAAGIMGGLFFLIGILVGYFSHHTSSTKPGPSPTLITIDVDDYILKHVKEEFLQKTIREFSAKPRIAGTQDNYDLALSIKSTWEAAGVENVHLDTYQAMLSLANESNPNKVELFNTNTSTVISMAPQWEPNLRPADENFSVPTYNAFSPAGFVSGAIVYVNYGRTEDLDYVINNLHIDLSGKILLVRLGKIYRWAKVRNAERYNASAVILYADPGDSNASMEKGESPYPASWWMPNTAVQQGTLVEQGGLDTDSLGYPTTESVYVPPLDHTKLPQILCQPVSYGFALKILSNMSGPAAPTEWKGGLPIDYRVGPGWDGEDQVELRVTVNNYLVNASIYNVVGKITGAVEQDRYVIVGSHHDSWSVGATDPHSGGATLTQIAAMYGDLLKMGYRPRRTILFCSWDAGEFGSLGAGEWVKDHFQALHQDAIAYINTDYVAEGHFTLGAETSPLLQDSLYAAAKKIPSPEEGFKTLFDLWLHRSQIHDKDIQDPSVSYSYSSTGDHVPFYSEVGVATANMFTTFDKSKHKMRTYPLHHTGYDTPHLYEKYQDPGLTFTKAFVKLIAIWVNDIANSTLIPFKVERLSSFIEGKLGEVINTNREEWEKRKVNIDQLTSAAHNFTQAAKQFQMTIVNEKERMKVALFAQRRFNDKMMQLGKLFASPRGLPGMPSQKNILLACDRIKTDLHIYFPGITTTMAKILGGNQELWPVLKQQVSLATFYIQDAARSLSENSIL